jgi:hypothetical protein
MKHPLLAALGTVLLTASLSPAADTYSWGNVRFEGGGFVSGLVASHTQPGLIYARTDVGGAYRWDSLGGNWIPLTDWIPESSRGLFGVEALALDPQDSKRLYLLCGNGDLNYGKTAILRSADYGASFDTVIVTSQIKAHGNGNGRQTGEKLAVDPKNSAILFCGSRTAGLWKSTDTGRTWTQAATLGANASGALVNTNGVSFVVFDPNSGTTAGGGTKTLYVGFSVADGGNNLFVSNDGGTTFSKIPGGPAFMPMRSVLSNGNLCITYSDQPGPTTSGGAIYKYAIAGGTWTNITPKDTAGNYYGTSASGFSCGFGGISVDPSNPNHMVASTLGSWSNQWRWPNRTDNYGDRIFVSNDGGANWTSTSTNANITATNSNMDPNGNNWISGNAIHWAGSLQFDPSHPNRVWVTSGNGVFRTDDISAVSPIWAFQSRGLEETVPLDIVSVPGGPLVTALGDVDGGVYTDITQSVPRPSPPVGTTNSLGYAPLTGEMLRTGVVTEYGQYSSTNWNKMFYSHDQGTSWKETDSTKTKGSNGLVALSADGKVFLHRPQDGSTVYRSADSGASWTAISGFSSNGGTIVPDPVDPTRFYTMTSGDQAQIYASSDAGMTFAQVGTLVDNGKGLYASSTQLIRTVPGKQGELWAPLDQFQDWTPGGYGHNGLGVSEDGGATWTRLPGVSICVAIGLGKAAPGASYFALYMWGSPAASDPVGIYRSTDKGATWVRINDDAHQFGGPGNGEFVVGDFNVYGRVYMSTAGRGLVYGNIGPVTTGIVGADAKAPLASLAQRGSLLWVHASGQPNLRLEFRSLDGRMLRSLDVSDAQGVGLSDLPHGVLLARLLSGGRMLSSRTLARD